MDRIESSIVSPFPESVRKKVLLALYWWEDRIFEGVARFASEHGWVLDCRMRWLNTLPELESWNGDGIIANPGAGKPVASLIKLIGSSRLPTVGLQSFGDYPCATRVVQDHAEIGKMAARHFLSLGFETLGFVLFAENPIERARLYGFAEAAHEAGAECLEIPFRQLKTFLNENTGPIGLMAANDLNATGVVTTCQDLGKKVPEEVAVIGVDDTRTLCEFAEVPLTSVNCNFETIGYQAAAALHRIMEGQIPPETALVVNPSGISQRRSTDTIAIPDVAAMKALRIIRDRFREPIRIADVARATGASIRRLQSAFREHLGFTMMQELTRLRIEYSKRLLADPKLKLDAVALESGFASRFQFIRAFRRVFGSTPSVFRKQIRDEEFNRS